MNEGIFRKEVLAARRGDRLGGIQLQSPRFGWIFLTLGVLVVVGILALLTSGHYTQHERVDGSLVPSGGLLSVVASSPGIINRLMIAEGTQVRAGQPLIEVSGEQESVALGGTRDAIVAQLRIKRDQLRSETREATEVAAVQRQEMIERAGMLHDQIAQIGDQMALQKQRVDGSSALYEQWSNLRASGIVTKLQILQQHDNALQNAVQLKEFNRQQLDAKKQLSQLESELKQLPVNLQTKRHELGRQLADIEQGLSENEAQRAVVLRAPADGTITNMMIHVGQTVTSQQVLMAVLPAHTMLQAELWVPSRAIGFLSKGNRVVLHYQAYPYQKFGEHFGSIESVSRSAVAPIELSKLIGKDIVEARYRVLVNLDNQSVLLYDKKEALRPGMTFDADILLDRRRLIEWAFEPILGIARSSHTAPLAEISQR
jgi:membrane fusion protein